MQFIPGEYFQNNVAELTDTCEWLMIDLYAFSGKIFV